MACLPPSRGIQRGIVFLHRTCLSLTILLIMAVVTAAQAPEDVLTSRVPGHPRLFFTASELKGLQAKRNAPGVPGLIWKNIKTSADWCLTRPLRKEWIAPVTPDPIYLNLYDRFYAMMHDMAVMEHLAFAYAYSGDPRYFDGAKQWALAAGHIWQKEAEGEPDQNKAYAALRLLKGLAVCYDLLYDRLAPADRDELRSIILDIGGRYYQWYVKNPTMAGTGQDKHHGSVEASSFGIAALTLLGEVPEATDWLALAVKKHTKYLLPEALTKSGTQEQTSNYWASTMQYRLFFMDALRRVTGRNLFPTFKQYMDGRIALAAVAGRKKPGYDEEQQSILFAPSYGQLNYWSPILLYLAREYRRPIYQHLALWDTDLGAIQKTRYVTPNGEMLLFTMGAYSYAWYDATVPDQIEPNLPRAFVFDDVNEAYVRSSYKEGAIVAGIRQGTVVVHGGGRPVLVDMYNFHNPPKSVTNLTASEGKDGATILCGGSPTSDFTEQALMLRAPGILTLQRKTTKSVQWWCHGNPKRTGNTLLWPDGTRLSVVRGKLTSLKPGGYQDEKVVGLGKLKLRDPMPTTYPLLTAQPADGELVIEIQTAAQPKTVQKLKGKGR